MTTTDAPTHAQDTAATRGAPRAGTQEPLTIFEKSSPGRRGVRVPTTDVPDVDPASVLPEGATRGAKAELPEVGELGVLRHYTHLSTLNFSIANAFYPLGSCTMKYNPLVNEKVAALPGFAALHPMQADDQAQGMLELYWRLERLLCEVSGLHAASIHPTAGAHGELTALMCMRKYLDEHGGKDRKVILIPDSAHGTNPASCTMSGFTTRELKSNADGAVDMDALDEVLGPDVAGLMITNPSTLGLFEPNIRRICEKIHGVGGLVYMDGANMNAILGRARPGEFGVDVMHFNLHKTFSQPHGGGGPGAGPIAVSEALAPYLPTPKVELVEATGGGGAHGADPGPDARFRIVHCAEHSIGTTRGFLGNSGVVVRAYSYIRSLGERGLKRVSENAVLNANYLRVMLRDTYRVWFPGPCMHEFVASAKGMPNGIKATDVAKRLIDYGIHPPTIYFPLIVPEALMIEPTETESKETLDEFVAAMKAIHAEAENDPDVLHTAPHSRCIGRPDEVRAVKEPKVTV